MTINRENYEMFVIDFIDGNLSPELREEFMAFLLQNPDIAIQVDGIADYRLQATDEVLPISKYHLKKSESLSDADISQAEYLCIAELEDDLLTEEENLLNELKKSDDKVAQLSSQFAFTKLVPEQIEYPQKSRLKREFVLGIPKKIVIGVSSAAAIFLFGLLVNTLILDFSKEALIAEHQPTGGVKIAPKDESITIEENNSPAQTEMKVADSKSPNKISPDKTLFVDENPKEKSIDEHFSIRPINPKQPTINPIVKHEDLQIKPNVIMVASMQSSRTVNPNVQSSTKEITLADIAKMGALKLAQKAGVKVDVKEDAKNKAKRIVVDSKLIAFSATIFPKED